MCAKRVALVVAGAVGLGVWGYGIAIGRAEPSVPAASPAEQRWAAEFAKKLTGPDTEGFPFSFRYGGRPSRELLGAWKRTEDRAPLDSRRSRHLAKFLDPRTGLEVRVEAVEYHDFPTVEWTLFFRNTAPSATPILEDIQALDVTWQRGGEAEYVLHHAAGSQANRSDYAPRESLLGPKVVKRFGGAGGRPTNVDWSYFNLQWGNRGAIVVVGWPGQWAAEFARDAGRGLRIRAGQERVYAKLLPGEEVRSPRMVVQFWEGDRLRAHNVWRRWMMAHNMPKPGGSLPPPQFVASSSRAYEEMIKANEQNQIMHIDRYLEEGLKIDYWWMDAGWYIQQHGWPQVGTWEVDPKRFPRGLKAISDHAHARGVKILVWFEPERVMPGTWLYENHPEWLLKPTSQANPLAGMRAWSASQVGGSDPCVSHNPTSQERSMANIRWAPGSLSFHPGPQGQYAVVRFTAPEGGEYTISALFTGIDRSPTTTDVHVLCRGKPVFQGWVNLKGQGNQTAFSGKLTLSQGDPVDFVVGWGNGTHVCDSTGLEARLVAPSGRCYDAAKEFHPEKNPHAPWSYGWLAPGPAPEAASFRLFDRPVKPGEEGIRLLNLGNPDARKWLTEHIDRLLVEQGIDLYRQDFNMDPLEFWRAADAPDRQGITENKHVTGYLAYWDELRRRHPNMLIDSCASGGRRNDLETMRRAVPLWRSDYAFEPIGHQCMTYGISLWLPYHGTGTVASAAAPYYGGGFTKVEPYAFWSNAAPSLGCGIDIRVRQLDYNTLRRLYRQWRQLSRFYYGDFYPLTPYTQDNRQWIAWQFHDPLEQAGVVQAFRRDQCPTDTLRLRLHDLDGTGTYRFTAFEGEAPSEASGKDLVAEGLPASTRERPGAVVLLYRRK